MREGINALSDTASREDLLNSLNLLENILNSIQSFLAGVDSGGRVIHWNRGAELFTGISSSDANGRIIHEAVPFLKTKMDVILSAIRDRKTIIEDRISFLEGRGNRCIEMTVYPFAAEIAEGAVIRLDDVTDHIRIQELLVQAEKMRSIEGLIAGVAHEINNPLAGILQNIQVIRSRLVENLPANNLAAKECGTTLETISSYIDRRDILPMLDSVTEAGAHAVNIIKTLLGFRDNYEEKTAFHDPGELLDKAVLIAESDYVLKKELKFREIEVVREYGLHVSPLWCNGTQIQQVFLCLLRNSAEALSEKNKKEKTAGRIVLRTGMDQHMVRFEIEDNGLGMEEYTKRKIYEPFFTTKQVGKGTGLGLSVAYFIITAIHSGTLEIETAPGRGFRAIIRLPSGSKENGQNA